VRYFSKNVGISTKLISFYSLDSETSVAIADSLKKEIVSCNLSRTNVTACCANNASVNFGKNRSGGTELRQANSEIISMGCNCHIIHNAIKHATVSRKHRSRKRSRNMAKSSQSIRKEKRNSGEVEEHTTRRNIHVPSKAFLNTLCGCSKGCNDKVSEEAEVKTKVRLYIVMSKETVHTHPTISTNLN
jgi:hypothetical protein